MALGKLRRDVPLLTHCPHVDGFRISTGPIPECPFSTSYIDNSVRPSPFLIRREGGHNLASPTSIATFSPGFGCAKFRAAFTSAGELGKPSSLYFGSIPSAFHRRKKRRHGLREHATQLHYWGPGKECGLEKVFMISQGKNLRFRTDFFNLFNHPSFANPPSAAVATPGPGSPVIGSAPIILVVGTSRLIQFSLKYSFEGFEERDGQNGLL